MHLACTRFLFFTAFIACAVFLGMAVHLQYAYDLSPCLLCYWQRALLAACCVVCLVASLHGPTARGGRLYCVLLLVMAISGAVVAGFQVHLQTTAPAQLLPMLAHLESAFDSLSLDAWGDRLHSESLLCAEVNWSLLGISLPEWGLLAFVGLMLFAASPLFMQLRHKILSDDQTLV